MEQASLSENNSNKALILFLLNLFSTIAFAVMFSSLELYLSQRFYFSQPDATTIMGVFLGLNYSLKLLGSSVGGRLVSYRLLFSIVCMLQVISCFILLILKTQSILFIAIALFTLSSGIMTPCINMMLIQQYQHNSVQREKAFLWNYSGMNIGFLVGFSLSSIYDTNNNFHAMFLYSLLANCIAVVITLISWRKLEDHTTPLAFFIKQTNSQKQKILRFFAFIAILFLTFCLVRLLITKSLITQNTILLLSLGMLLFFIFNGIKNRRIIAFLILASANVVFWSIYQLIPTGMVFFINNDVMKNIGDIHLTPQFFNIINAIIIVIGGFLFPPLFKQIRKKRTFDVPIQFTIAILSISISLFALLLGFFFQDSHGLISMWWVVAFYFILSIAELLIAPIGVAMIAALSSENLQGYMMGTWLLLSGLSAIIAGKISSLATRSTGKLLHQESIVFHHFFIYLFITSLCVACTLFLTRNFIRRLIAGI